MVNRLLNFLGREQRGLHEAALLLGIFAFLSQILGFFRDRLLASQFGAGETLDVYYAAFRVPDFIFIWGASMVSLSVLIPFLSRRLSESRISAREFLDTVFSAFFIGISFVAILAFFVAPYFVNISFPGFSVQSKELTVYLMRIMLFQPILLGISNLFGSVTQLERRFFVYAISPLLYNFGIIVGIVFLFPIIGISGLAWGVVFGALLHLIVQIPVIFRSGLLPRFRFNLDFSILKEVILISLPRTLALSFQNLSALALISLGSVLGAGSIAVFNLAWNLQSIPLAMIGASYSLAAFPTLSMLWNGGKQDKFKETLNIAVRHILFWSFPALSLLIVLRAQIVRTILGAGAFDWGDTRLTAAALALFALSVVAQSLSLLFTRCYYAAGKTRVPLLISFFTAVGGVALAFILSSLFSSSIFFRSFLETLLRVSDLSGTSVLVLPLAYSISSLAGAFAFWFIYEKQFSKIGSDALRTFWQSLSTSIIIGFVAYLFLNLFDNIFDLKTTFGIFSQGLVSGLGGIVSGVLILRLIGNREIREFSKIVQEKFWRVKFIGPDQTDTTF